MKKLILLFSLSLFTIAAGLSQGGPEIQMDKKVHDYGTVTTEHDGNCEFTVTNTGNKPLILSHVKPSCNCTVPTWPKDPIKPGESAVIKVHYNTNRVGAINKSITISSNAINAPRLVIRIKGKVISG